MPETGRVGLVTFGAVYPDGSECNCVFPVKIRGHILLFQKKRYKSCHWDCTFSKAKLLSILGANMYSLGANMYI